MGYGPFAGSTRSFSLAQGPRGLADPLFYAFVPQRTGKAAGMGSSCASTPSNGVIEIGHIWMSPDLQQTREATEAIYLMMRHALDDLGCRRLEWKCDALNAPRARRPTASASPSRAFSASI